MMLATLALCSVIQYLSYPFHYINFKDNLYQLAVLNRYYQLSTVGSGPIAIIHTVTGEVKITPAQVSSWVNNKPLIHHWSWDGQTLYFPQCAFYTDKVKLANPTIRLTAGIGYCDSKLLAQAIPLADYKSRLKSKQQIFQGIPGYNHLNYTTRYTSMPPHIRTFAKDVFYTFACYTNSNPVCYVKTPGELNQYQPGVLDSSEPEWNDVSYIPLATQGNFYVYQTSEKAFCILDSTRQLSYITKNDQSEFKVKPLAKLDYPVKIVYGGKTIDIIAANTSYHLNEQGELSSPAKTVWPKPQK